jgi:carbonic anhydrase
MDVEKVFQNNKRWVSEKLKVDKDFFEKLSKGQTPEFLYIGCSDSRVTAEDMMGAKPGDVFVHRNIANVVSNLDLSSMSVINYAVKFLKVNHIVVCGHYNCGGVKAAMEPRDLGILNPWLRNIRDVYRMHRGELNAIKDEEAKYKRLVELNVREQCVNVLKAAEVQLAVSERDLKVHGWVFDIRTGKLIDLNINIDNILFGVTEIYKLK